MNGVVLSLCDLTTVACQPWAASTGYFLVLDRLEPERIGLCDRGSGCRVGRLTCTRLLLGATGPVAHAFVGVVVLRHRALLVAMCHDARREMDATSAFSDAADLLDVSAESSYLTHAA